MGTACPEKRQQEWQSWYERNRDSYLEKQRSCPKRKEYARQRYLKKKQEIREKQSEYSKTPSAKSLKCAREAGRRQRKKFPLTEEQKSEIQNFYWLAQDLKRITGEDYHVDHIIPLKGENVSGLHVPWNLQVLPSDINLFKSNKLGEEL
jgi:hypothetical protein